MEIKKVIKTYQLDLKINQEKIQEFENIIFHCRNLYNLIIEYRRQVDEFCKYYHRRGESCILEADKEYFNPDNPKSNWRIAADKKEKYPQFRLDWLPPNSKGEERFFNWFTDKKGIDRISFNKFFIGPIITDLKKDFPEYDNLSSDIIEDVNKRVDLAYDKFIDGGGYPKKRKGKLWNRYRSFSFRNKRNSLRISVELIDGRQQLFLVLPKMGKVKINNKSKIPTTPLKTCVIKKEGKRWFAYVTAEAEIIPYEKTGKKVGLDAGIRYLVTDSDGKSIENPKTYRKSMRKMKRIQKKKQHKEDCLKKREEYRKAVEKETGIKTEPILVSKRCIQYRDKEVALHSKIARQRRGFRHKFTTEYIKNYDHIVIEDLKINNLLKNSKLAKDIADSSWGMTTLLLEQKAKIHDRKIDRVNPAYTSMTCHKCAHINRHSTGKTFWTCENCGETHDRDLNAAIVIRDNDKYKELQRISKELKEQLDNGTYKEEGMSIEGNKEEKPKLDRPIRKPIKVKEKHKLKAYVELNKEAFNNGKSKDINKDQLSLFQA